MKYFEGHCHSCYSDGFRTPEELVKEAYDNGIRGLFVSDHNTFTFDQPFMYNNDDNGASADEMLVLPAAELSAVYHVPETDMKKEIHIIAVFKGEVPEMVKAILPSRDQHVYHQAILDKLRDEAGIKVTLADIYDQYIPHRHFGRPQIADYLTAHGFATSREDAMDRFIGNYSPYYINPIDYLDYPEVETVVKTVLEAGGIAVLAHPFAYMLGKKTSELIRYYASLAEHWRLGLEVYYSKYDDNQVHQLEELADEYFLLRSAGSDSHYREQPLYKGDYNLFLRLLNKMIEEENKHEQ